jgi:serine/threonine protein kinase
MAPEQYSLTQVDWKADQYSIGVICYRILTGCMPFNEDCKEDYLKVQSLNPADPAAVNAKLKQPLCKFLQKILAADPAKRFNSPNDIQLAFDVANAMKTVQPILESKSVSISAIRKEPQKSNLPKVYFQLFILIATLYLLYLLGTK